MKKFLWIGLIMCISLDTYSQMAIGLVTGNYAGSTGTFMNPSSMANSKLKSDINILAINVFAENNYLYFPSRESSLIKLFNGVYDFHFFPKPYGTGERNVYTYYQDRSLKNIFGNIRVIGPSYMFSYNDHVFAVTTGFRVMSSTRRLPYDMANFSFYGMDFKPQQNIYFVRNNYDMASMAWWELKFSYATVLKRSHSSLWSAGISIGPVFSHSGAYLHGGDTRYIAYNDSTLNVELLNAEFGISLPVDYDDDDVDFVDPLIRGIGWGMDLGFTWQFRKKPYQKKFPGNFYNKRFEDYKWKIGVSFLDIGWVKFTKNAEKHVYDNVSNNWIRVDELEYNNIRDEIRVASNLFYGDPNASLRATSFRLFLPASVSVQVDYHISKWWFVNGTVMIPAAYASPMIERPVVMALTPRFESRFLEINIPVVLYDLKYPRIGISLRLEGLTIGSDNLGGFLSIRDFTGADFYISYKINLVNDGKNPFTSKGACFNNWRLDLKRMHKVKL
jgi:hypothetical protein